MKYAILVRGTWNIGQSYHLSLSLLPSTPYTFYPLACHFFVVISLLPSAPYRSYPPVCHFCGYPSHIVHDSPLPEPTNTPKSCAVPSVTHTDLESTSELPFTPDFDQMGRLPNVPGITFINRVLDKPYSDSIWRFAMLSVDSVMYTDSLRTRLGDPQVGPILAVKCLRSKCTLPLMRVWGRSALCGARCVGVGRREPEEFHSFIRTLRSKEEAPRACQWECTTLCEPTGTRVRDGVVRTHLPRRA